VTRSTRTRLRRAIGLALALGVVITPNALAKAYADPASVLTPIKVTTANGYSFYRPAVASAIAMKHATYSGSSFYRPAPAKVTYYDAWHVPAMSSAGGAIAVTHDTWGGDIRGSRVGVTPAVSATTFHDSWGKDVRTAVPSQPAATGSSSNDTRNILLAASAAARSC
jgi:hypothetical protein